MYGKLFASTFTGSLYGKGPTLISVWAWIIANTKFGSVEINPALVSQSIGLSIGEVESALECLSSPDPKSRSPAEEGRRIVREGMYQWRVVNHESYRQIRHEDDRREYNRLKKQEERARKKASKSACVSQKVNDCQCLSAQQEREQEQEEDLSSSPIKNIGEEEVVAIRQRPAIPPCPIEKIIEAYHEILPMCRPTMIRNKTRDGYIRQRWKEKPDLGYWQRYFQHVSKSDFLCSRVQPANGRPPFEASLEWLMRPNNYANVVEGKYHV